MQVAFGLYVAGYSTGASALARAVLAEDGVVDPTVYTGQVFAWKPKLGHFEEHHREEVAVLRRLTDLRRDGAMGNPQGTRR